MEKKKVGKYEVTPMTPGEEIRLIRHKKGMSLKKLCNRIERHGKSIYPSTISRLENNLTVSPGADLLIAIAVALELEDLYFVKKYFDQNIKLLPNQSEPAFMKKVEFSLANFKDITRTTFDELQKAIDKIDQLEKAVRDLEAKTSKTGS